MIALFAPENPHMAGKFEAQKEVTRLIDRPYYWNKSVEDPASGRQGTVDNVEVSDVPLKINSNTYK